MPTPNKGISLFDSFGTPIQFQYVGFTAHHPVISASEGIPGSAAPSIAIQLAGLDPTSPIFQGSPSAGVLHNIAVTAAGALVTIDEDAEYASSTRIFSASNGNRAVTVGSDAAPTPILSIRPLAGQTSTIFLLRSLRLVGSGARIFWQLIYNGSLAVSTASITATSISLNLLTVTCTNSFVAGQSVLLAGTGESFLNGQTVTVIGANSTHFVASFTHADYTNSADTGTASVLPAFQSVNVNSGVSYDTSSTAINGGEIMDSGYLQLPDNHQYEVHFGFTSSVADTLTLAMTLMVGAAPQRVNTSMRWTERANT